ncbi:type IX secretion system membrane protein PorP/SprF [Fulvivirga sp. M361]|uniref:PorP/SprF family type IX secretion system membrane protein n=1 Tax=Fulvivirga sp. M361 TaxID=2594266 RepID=UPI0016287254|nr:type IX secretion system membrane protein PorP/SprF [Fulvivirga sp. M361]
MKKVILVIVLTSYAWFTNAQQDPLLSQYQFNQLPINPAYTGVNDMTSFDLHYRSQWGGVAGAPTTITFSGNSSLFENKVGLGLSLVHDETGVTKNTNFNLAYAYELDLSNDMTLSFGLQTGILSLRYNFGELTLDDPTDEDFTNADDGLTKLNFGTGLFISNEKYYLGVSVPRLLKATEGIGENIGERYNRHYYFTGGLIIDKSQSVKLKPFAVLRLAEDSPLSTDIGISVLLADVIWAGVFTRNFNVYGISAFLNLNNGFRLGYTGELTSNDSPASTFSTHEVSVGIDLELFANQAVARRYY